MAYYSYKMGGLYETSPYKRDLGIKLAQDEYPISVVLSNTWVENRTSEPSGADYHRVEDFDIFLCDANYNRKHVFCHGTATRGNGVDVDGTRNLQSRTEDGKTYSPTELAGASLALYYEAGYWYVFFRSHYDNATIGINTSYIAYGITYAKVTGGTISGANSAARGAAVTITITPDAGYALQSLTASAGTLTRVNATTYTLTMPSPGAAVTVTPTWLKHSLTANSPGISFSQNEYALTITKSGSVTDNFGHSVSYRLYRNNVLMGTFSGNSMTITLTDDQCEVEYTYRIDAVCDLTTITFITQKFTAASVHKTFGYYTGSSFLPAIGYYWTGSAWQEVWPYYYNGNEWVLCSIT